VDLFLGGGYEALLKDLIRSPTVPVGRERVSRGRETRDSLYPSWLWKLILIVLIVACGGLAAIWWNHYKRSSFSRWAAEKCVLLLQEFPQEHDLPLLLALAATEVHLMEESREAMLRATVAAGRIQTSHRSCCRLAFSGDGNVLSTAGQDDTVNVWRIGDRSRARPSIQFSYGGAVHALAFNSDATRLAIGGSNGSAEIWDPKSASGEPLMQLTPPHADTIMDARFSPRRQETPETLATASFDGVVRVWDTSAVRPLNDISVGARAIVTVDFTSDGSRLAICTKHGDIVIWDMIRSTTSIRFSAQADPADSMAGAVFSSDGTKLATASEQGYLKIWDASTGKIVSEFPRSGATVFRTVHFRPTLGLELLTVDADNTIRRWRDQSSSTLWVPLDTVKLSHSAMTPDGSKFAIGDHNGFVSIYYLNLSELLQQGYALMDWPSAERQCVAHLEKGQCKALAEAAQRVRTRE
jgi:WD40 repeat protein